MAKNVVGIETDNPGNYNTKHNNREKKLMETIRENTNLEDTFTSPIVISAANLKDGSPDFLLLDSTLAALDILSFSTGEAQYTCNVQSVNGTVINTFPAQRATGLELVVTDGAADGVLGWEISPGGFFANSKHGHTVGSLLKGADKDVFVEVAMTCTTATSIEEFVVGFRSAATPIAEFDDYLDFAALRIDTSQNVQMESILNNAGADTTDTTVNLADATQITLRIEVTNAGNARFLVNGTEYTHDTAMVFDADTIIPFVHLITSTGDPVCILNSFKCGYM